MLNSVSIIEVLLFALTYIFFQQLKRVMIREMDDVIYKSIIDYLLSGEYYFIGISIMVIGNFNKYEVLIGFALMFLLRFLYNHVAYTYIYKKLQRKIKSHNIYKK